MSMRSLKLGLLCATLLAVGPAGAALADEHGHHQFHGHDVRRFDAHDRALWRRGMWRHEYFNGRLGWWWMVGGARYFYDAPVYPYPLMVSGLAFAAPVVAAPPVVVVQQQPPPVVMQQQPPPPPPAQPQIYYYCDNPPGYYPNVPTCATPFRPVPAPPQ